MQIILNNIEGNRTHRYVILVDGKPSYDKTCDGLATPQTPDEAKCQIATPKGPRVMLLFAPDQITSVAASRIAPECTFWRLLRKPERETGGVLQILKSAVRGGTQLAEVVLQQEGHTISASSVTADGIDAVAGSDHRL